VTAASGSAAHVTSLCT